MANGAYVGVQGIAPDLRPSIQTAQQAAQERQAQRQAQKNWEKEFEQKERQLDIQEKQAETEQIKAQNAGIKTYLEQNSKWGTEFEKRCLSAKEDISKQPAFLQLANPIFEEIASLREIATTGDFESANKAKAKAEQLYSNLVQLATYCKDYSVAIPQDAFDKSNFAGFTTDLIDGKDTGDWLNGFTNTNWTYYRNQDGGSYISNGAAHIGLNANGDFSIRVGEEEFSSPDALKRYLSNHVIAKDNMLVDEVGKLSTLKPQTQKTGTDGNIRTVNDIGTFTSSLRTQVDNILSKYPDDYSVEQARKDKDGAILELFTRYGTDSNVDTVGELKISIVYEYSSKFPRVVETVTKDEKDSVAPFNNPAGDLTNPNNRQELITITSGMNAAAKNRANINKRIFNIVDAVNDLVTGDASGADTFSQYGYKASKRKDGRIAITPKGTETYGYSDGKESINTSNKEGDTFDPHDATSMRSLIEMIVNADNANNKDLPNITQNDLDSIIDFGGFSKVPSDRDEVANIEALMDFYDDNTSKNNVNIKIGEQVGEVKDIVRDYIQSYLDKKGSDYSVQVVPKRGWSNSISIAITDKDGNTTTYTMNTNIADEEKKSGKWVGKDVRSVLSKILNDYPVDKVSGSLYRKTASQNTGGSRIIGQNPFAFNNQNTVVTTATLNL